MRFSSSFMIQCHEFFFLSGAFGYFLIEFCFDSKKWWLFIPLCFLWR